VTVPITVSLLPPITDYYPDSYDSSTDSGSGGGPGNGHGKGRPYAVGGNIDLSDPSVWGQAIHKDAQGNPSLYVRDLGNGEKVFTFVTWVH